MLESIEYSFANTHFEYSSNKAIWCASVPLPARGSAVQVIEEATQLQLRQAKGWVRPKNEPKSQI